MERDIIDLTALQQNKRPELPEIPRYRCHKEVQAVKIGKVQADADLALKNNRETDSTYWITPEDETLPALKVSHAFIQRHLPMVGQYLVIYEDGYISVSPREAFEKGYRLIT